MTTNAAELEISLHRRDADRYRVDLRFHQPDSEADVRPAAQELSPLRIDHDALLRAVDSAAYGRELTQRLFVEAGVERALAGARTAAESQDATLRLRLFIGPSAPELHALRWETLRDPVNGEPLLTNENLIFSRYLSSLDWRPVRLRPQADLTALVAVAGPLNAPEWGLAAVDVAQELATARTGLGDIARTELARPNDDAPGAATLDNIVEALREETDIFYLVAHGKLVNGEPTLYLEDEVGQTAIIPGSELVARLRELAHRPRLIVLASCQSAGDGGSAINGGADDGALAALGPRLAEVGITAVLAMQGNISMETVRQLMPVFFTELRRDGQIDRALAAARGAVRSRPDWWIPTLFMRLKSGRIWYVPGFSDDSQELQQWPALLRTIERGRCTPILGPGVGEALLGSRQEIARRWAETYHFPLEAHQQEDLPHVAQFLAVNQGVFFLQDELESHLRRELWQAFGESLDPALAEAGLIELLDAVSERLYAGDEPTIYSTLARLDLPIYITANPDNLLFDALRAQGKAPIYDFCRWNAASERLPLRYNEERDEPPTPERPLIYHLFGHLAEPDTLVLTGGRLLRLPDRRDEQQRSHPLRSAAGAGRIRRCSFSAFASTSGIFACSFAASSSAKGAVAAAATPTSPRRSTPAEGRILEPNGARDYLESRFRDADINLFWGSVDDFHQALLEKLK